MNVRIAHVAFLVRDYDEAMAFFVEKLQFELLEDTPVDGDKRWVMVIPRGDGQCALLLAKASTPRQQDRVGDQHGGRVGFFLFTDHFQRDYDHFIQKGVHFVRPPKDYPYGRVAVFQDLYGNLWDLIEPTAANKGLPGSRQNIEDQH